MQLYLLLVKLEILNYSILVECFQWIQYQLRVSQILLEILIVRMNCLGYYSIYFCLFRKYLYNHLLMDLVKDMFFYQVDKFEAYIFLRLSTIYLEDSPQDHIYPDNPFPYYNIDQFHIHYLNSKP